MGTEDGSQLTLGLRQPHGLAHLAGLMAFDFDELHAVGPEASVEPVFACLDRAKVAVPAFGASVLTFDGTGFDVFDDDAGNRIEASQPDEDIVFELPAGASRGWQPVLLTGTIRSAGPTRGLTATTGTTSVSPGLYGFTDTFTVGGVGLNIEERALLGFHRVAFHLGSWVDAQSDRLGVAVLTLGEDDVEESVLVTWGGFAFRDEFAGTGWVARHKRFACPGYDGDPAGLMWV